MEDVYVRCCRCKNVHLYSERKEGEADKRHGMRPCICPRCRGHSFTVLHSRFEEVRANQPPKNEG